MKNKSILKQLIIAGAVLALLFGGGIATVVLIFPTDKVVALCPSQAEKTTGRRITLEKAGFTFFPRPGITLSGLSVENTTRANFSRAPFLTVEKFTAGISIASLFKASPEITRIVLKKPVLRIEISEQGQINAGHRRTQGQRFAATIAARHPVFPYPSLFRSLSLRAGHSSMTIGKRESRLPWEPSTRRRGSSSIPPCPEYRLRRNAPAERHFGESRGVPGAAGGPRCNLDARYRRDLPAGTVTVNRINVSCGKIVCAVTGTMKDVMTSAPMLDLTLSAPMVNAANLLVLVPASIMPFVPGLSASGSITFGARLQGRMLPGMPPLFSGFG